MDNLLLWVCITTLCTNSYMTSVAGGGFDLPSDDYFFGSSSEKEKKKPSCFNTSYESPCTIFYYVFEGTQFSVVTATKTR